MVTQIICCVDLPPFDPGYHLYRMGSYQESLQVLQECLRLQQQGFGSRVGLPPCYGDISQTLAALGRFREAQFYDEQAHLEIQRLAQLGHVAEKAEIWIYRVNRDCLYPRLARITH